MVYSHCIPHPLQKSVTVIRDNYTAAPVQMRFGVRTFFNWVGHIFTLLAFLLLLLLLEVLSLNSGVAKQQCKTGTTLEGGEKVQTFLFL